MNHYEPTCERCEDGTHIDSDLIYVDEKYFCPMTLRRVYYQEEQEEMTEEEQQSSWDEKLLVVRKGTPTKYKVIRETRASAVEG